MDMGHNFLLVRSALQEFQKQKSSQESIGPRQHNHQQVHLGSAAAGAAECQSASSLSDTKRSSRRSEAWMVFVSLP